MGEGWTKEWERRVVNGVYPLRRFLGQSDHSVVFLTECKAQDLAQAAIKIIPMPEPALAEAQLGQWRRVASLSHPHLIRLLDSGRCQLGRHDFLFVVTEYAEQNLAQVLPGRALSPDEVRNLLRATLDALSYLHGEHLVQGGLKPSNFLVVDDELKLASDTIRPAGERAAGTAQRSSYDPPEAKNGRASAAADIWALGITLVEALTQTPPAWSRESSERVALPADLAPEFVETVERCLNRDAARRPATAELIARFNQPAPATSPSDALPAVTALPAVRAAAPPAAALPSAVLPSAAPPTAVRAAAPPTLNDPRDLASSIRGLLNGRFFVAAIASAMVTLCAIWAGVHLMHSRPDVQQATTPAPPSAAPAPSAVENRPADVTAPLPAVLHQVIPDVSRSARESIRGGVKIGVRVTVDRSGNVAAATLDTRATSRYFARAALNAAKQWKFAEGPDRTTRAWLLRFEFTRAGTTVHAAALR